MAWMVLESNITHILNAQPPASQNSTTFLKTIFFLGHPVFSSKIWIDLFFKTDIMSFNLILYNENSN